MKFLIQVLVSLVLCLLLQFFLPWWTLAIGTFVVAFVLDRSGWASFAAGFLAISLLWLMVAGYITFVTDSILTHKLNQLLPINSFVIMALVGGLVGGFGALTGAYFRKL